MGPVVREVRTSERLTAVVAASTSWAEFPSLWGKLLDEVYVFIRAGGATQSGHNVMLYKDGVPNIEVGVEVLGPFNPQGRVKMSSLPAAATAMAVHRGPYGKLGDGHDAIHRWAKAAGRTLAGPRWEIYGDWREDPNELETEIYYLLC